MQLKRLLPLAFAGIAFSQTILEALGSSNQTTALLGLLGTVNQTTPALLSALSSATNITLLAPSNDAISKLLANNATVAAIAKDPGLLIAVLQYHVLQGTYFASQVPTTPAFIPTLLDNSTYSNVTGGQVVEAVSRGGNVTFYSGLKINSTVTQANLNFTGGTIHVIDTVLTVPLGDADTAVAANLTALAGAVTVAGLGSTLLSLKDVTIFAPTNAAFAAIASIAGNASIDTLSAVLKYHVIPGNVLYSSTLANVSVATADGVNLTVTVFPDGQVFVNGAKVVTPDVLVANGVVHVIDNVLNPGNATATANPAASSGAPAFSGASSTGGVPFTSGVPAPTSTVPAGGAPTTTTSGGAAVPMRTGAMAAAALFGGAAVWVNM